MNALMRVGTRAATSGRTLVSRAYHQLTDQDVALYQAALVCIGISSVFVLNLLWEFPQRRLIWGDTSPWTSDLSTQYLDRNGGYSVLLWSTSHWWFECVYALAIMAGVCVALGWHTRLWMPVLAVMTMSFHDRVSMTSTAGDI